jgi:uncharacterized protein (DUF924 family)
MPVNLLESRDVLDFWFCERARLLWFEKDAAFDADIRLQFGQAIDDAFSGGFEDWRRDPDGALALLILLDQMPRNVFRDDARAFAGDARAMQVADKAIEAGQDRHFTFPRRRFFYLPFEHSEDPRDQDRSVALFEELAAAVPDEHRVDALEQLDYAHRHRVIIRRFGRYPHRNATLGRECTPEEAAFLTGPDSAL